jgi:Ni2+-binding GTPase involved in maturation of urease and hydrogenase
MNLHLVGGFLGSGKTTAIIQASRLLMGRGLRVGVITNDQGKYLVDTAFVRLADLPAVEVTGGCFCCNYDDLNGRLEELLASAHPQVIFAESVGSCADIVATVVKPLLELGGDRLSPTSFSVFADSRLLLRRLRGQEMPFSEDVVYIFDKQIEEAGLLVMNKADLLAPQMLSEIESKTAHAFPGKPTLLQSSLTAEGVWDWVNLIESGQISLPKDSLEIDYHRYAAGEASLAWLDQEVLLHVPEGTGKEVLAGCIRRLAAGLAERGAGIGHIKFIIRAENAETKLSIPTLEEPGWEESIPYLSGGWVNLLVNARAEIGAQELSDLLRQSLAVPDVRVEFQAGDAFHPGEPKPLHRIQ